MSELDREGFECMSFGHIMFDALLEFPRGERAATDALELVVGQCSRQQVAQLMVPGRLEAFRVPVGPNFVFEDILKLFFFVA